MGTVNNLQTKLEWKEGYFTDADDLVSHRIVRVLGGSINRSTPLQEFIRSRKGVNAFDPIPNDTHRIVSHFTSHKKKYIHLQIVIKFISSSHHLLIILIHRSLNHTSFTSNKLPIPISYQ